MKFYIVEPRVNDGKYTYYSNLVKELYLNEECVTHNSLGDCLLNCSPDDYIFLGLGFFEQFDSEAFFSKKLHACSFIKKSPAKKIAYIHKVKNKYEDKIEFCKLHGIDIIFTTTPLSEEIQRDSGIKTCVLEYGSNPNIFKPLGLEKKYDIGFSGALHENKFGLDSQVKNLRVLCGQELKKRDDLKVFWNASDSISKAYVPSITDYAQRINESKVWIAITGPAWDVNGRVSEVTLCKTTLLSNDIPKGHYDYFQDGVNCLRFKNDLSDFHEKIDQALASKDLISEKGYDLAIDKLTPNKIYQRLKSILSTL